MTNLSLSLSIVQPAIVTAHTVAVGQGAADKTVFLIKFSAEVMARERSLG